MLDGGQNKLLKRERSLNVIQKLQIVLAAGGDQNGASRALAEAPDLIEYRSIDIVGIMLVDQFI